MKSSIDILRIRVIFNKQFYITFLAIIGFSIHLFLLLSDVHNLTQNNSSINDQRDWDDNPMVLFLIFGLSITTAFSFAILPSILQKISILRKEYEVPPFLGFFYFILSLVIIELPILIQVLFGGKVNIANIALTENILFRHPRMVFQGGIIFISIFVVSCLFGVLLVNYILNNKFKEITLSQKKPHELLNISLLLRKDLKYFISVIITYLTILVLLLVINRQILITALGEEKAISKDLIFLLSTFYSFFIACIILPVYLNFKDKKRKLQNKQNEVMTIGQNNESKIFHIQIVEKARQLISEDNIDEAFDLVLKETQNSTVIDELTILKQRWFNFKKRRVKGLVSEESSGITMANIIDSLLEVIDQ